VTFRGAREDAVVEARIGAVEAGAPTAFSVAVAQADSAPAASTLKIKVRLRIVTMVRRGPVLTLRISRALHHTALRIRLRT
jgi:hypothetical protein